LDVKNTGWMDGWMDRWMVWQLEKTLFGCVPVVYLTMVVS
jgi:hypothetical protein